MAAIATSQHGLVTVVQLRRAGLDAAAVRRRVRAGRLHRVHRGVYAVGHPPLTTQSRYLAAVLACGEGAALSDAAAAHLLRLVRGPAPEPHVTTRMERSVPGVRTRHTRRLHPLDTAAFDGIPVTTVPRTLLDLAATCSLGDLARACHEAHVIHRTTPAQVEVAIGRTPNRKGVATLRQALLGDDLVLGQLEAEFVRVLTAAGFPLPRTNVRRREGRVDCVWPGSSLVVELDSYRFTWGDVFERPHEMLDELRPILF